MIEWHIFQAQVQDDLEKRVFLLGHHFLLYRLFWASLAFSLCWIFRIFSIGAFALLMMPQTSFLNYLGPNS